MFELSLCLLEARVSWVGVCPEFELFMTFIVFHVLEKEVCWFSVFMWLCQFSCFLLIVLFFIVLFRRVILVSFSGEGGCLRILFLVLIRVLISGVWFGL